MNNNALLKLAVMAAQEDLLKQAGLGSLLQRPFSVGGGELASLLSKQIHLPSVLGAGTRNAASTKAAEALKVILQGKQEAAQAAALKALAYGVPAGIGAGALGAYGLGELTEDDSMFGFAASDIDMLKQAGLGSLLQRPFSVGGGELASLLSKQIHLPGALGAGTRNAAKAQARAALKAIVQGKQEAAQAAAAKALAYGVPAGIGAGALGAYGLGELTEEEPWYAGLF